MTKKTANERFYTIMSQLCGWVLFVVLPASAVISIWTYEWRIVATAIAGLLALAMVAIGAKILVNDDKAASANDR